MEISSYCIRLTSYIGLLVSILCGLRGKECPPDAPQRAMTCVASFTGATQPGSQSLLSEWDLEKIDQACKDGVFSDGIRCAEHIIQSCIDDTNQAEYLQKYLNVPLLKEGVSRLCTQSVIDLKGDSKCIRDQKPKVKQCANTELKVFQESARKSNDDYDKILEAACLFLREVFVCQSSAVRKNCGSKSANELTKLTSYFLPPYCADKGISLGSGAGHLSYIPISSWIILLQLCAIGFL